MTFFKFLISAWGGQCDYSPGERQNKTRYATEGGRLYFPSVWLFACQYKGGYYAIHTHARVSKKWL